MKDYRGVTLLPTLYKVYVAVLTERLKENLEEKGVIPQNQTGFRKGMGTIDNIYVLNYIINRQLERRGRKMVTMFIDLKAGFDSIDRGVLIKAMEERGVRGGLIRRIEEVIRETKCRVRAAGEVGEEF